MEGMYICIQFVMPEGARYILNPLTPRRTIWFFLIKISIPFSEWIIKKNSYERRVYESVDDRSHALTAYCGKYITVKFFYCNDII